MMFTKRKQPRRRKTAERGKTLRGEFEEDGRRFWWEAELRQDCLEKQWALLGPCTQTSAPFKYFVNGNRDDEIFSSCAKLTASADPNFLKCYREVVFGNGKLVRDLCPIMCGNCAGDKNDEADKEQADEDFDGHKTFSFYVIVS